MAVKVIFSLKKVEFSGVGNSFEDGGADKLSVPPNFSTAKFTKYYLRQLFEYVYIFCKVCQVFISKND